MKSIWHYTKDGEFPTPDCTLLCCVDYRGYITVHYCVDGKYYGVESGDLIDVKDIASWVNLDSVLNCIDHK